MSMIWLALHTFAGCTCFHQCCKTTKFSCSVSWHPPAMSLSHAAQLVVPLVACLYSYCLPMHVCCSLCSDNNLSSKCNGIIPQEHSEVPIVAFLCSNFGHAYDLTTAIQHLRLKVVCVSCWQELTARTWAGAGVRGAPWLCACLCG